MAMTEGAPPPDDTGQGTPPDAGPPGADGGEPEGLLASLRQQQNGPPPSAPGAGTQANAMTMVMNALAMLKQAMLGLSPADPRHNDVNSAIGRLSRHFRNQGQPTAGVQQTQMQDQLRMIGRTALLQQLRQGGGQGGGGGGGQPPMPSTPLPGA